MLWYHKDHGVLDITSRADRRSMSATMPPLNQNDLWRPSVCIIDNHYCVQEQLFLPLEASPDACFEACYNFLLKAGWRVPTDDERSYHASTLHSAS